MEEPQSPMNSVDERSARTAEMLRALRDQTDKVLEAHHRRIEDLEEELTRRIQQVAEDLVQDQDADDVESAAANKQREQLRAAQEAVRKAEIEITSLRGQLAEQTSGQEAEMAARAAQLQQLQADCDQEAEQRAHLAEQAQQLLAERDQLLRERTSLSEELGQVLTDQLKSSEELVQLAEQLDQLQDDLDQASRERNQFAEELVQLQEDLDQTVRERNELTTQLEQLQDERDQARQERDLLAEEAQKAQVEHDRTAEDRDRLAEEMERLLADAQDLDRQRQQLTGELESFRAGESEMVKDRDELTAQLEQLRAELANVVTQRDQLTGESQSLQDRLDKLQAEKTAQAEECGRLTAELAAATQQSTEAQQRAQTLEAELQAQRDEHFQTNQALAESRAAGDEAAGELAKNEQLVVELRDEVEKQKSEYEAQLHDLKENLKQTERKCELALADVHKLKRANAELHEELVRRPETDDQQSPELVSLRAERDALAARVEELESSAEPQQDEDGQQAMSDLQRRFEMAVEDLRHLKQENASLRERLEAPPQATSEASDSGNMDWQAQKARLLASLDAEDTDTATPQRREERTTIEGTISITDRVVSEKDREIAELREQLETRPAVADKPSEEVREEAIRAAHEELFSSDETIQTERARLEQLQKEWKDKLRTAELEISVQRATLARDKAKLEEKLAFLQSQAAEVEATEGKPKRRWLSALGLNEDPPESGAS